MRTTFRRQVTLIVSLLLAATILLGVSFWGLFTHYVIRERESSLRGTAQSVVWLTQTSAVSDDVTTSWDFLRTLSVASSASGNDILLCDAGGKVVLCAQDIQGCSHIGYQLPADKVEALFNGESPDLNDEAAEIYGQKRVAVALARTSSDGDRQGIVLVSVERETISELTTGALKIFMLTALGRVCRGSACNAVPHKPRDEADSGHGRRSAPDRPRQSECPRFDELPDRGDGGAGCRLQQYGGRHAECRHCASGIRGQCQP